MNRPLQGALLAASPSVAWLLAAGLVASLLGGCAPEDSASSGGQRHPIRLTVTERPIFAPVGISTGGYAQSPSSSAPRSPFADNFQATTTLYHQPRVQVFRVQSGDDDVILAQTDLIGIHQDFWRRVTDLVEQLTGVDVRDRLVLMANHTHSGPGHIFDAFFAATVVDKFQPDIAERIASDVAKAIAESLSNGDSVPVEIGWTQLENAQMHRDRRCENPDLQDDTMSVLGFRTTSGELVALLINYAMHGTVFSPEHGMLSGDSAGAVEDAVAATSGAAVMFTQSWAGDMSPGHPKHLYDPARKASLPQLDKLESLGRSAQQSLAGIEDQLKWLKSPKIRVRSEEIAIDRARLKYAKDEFPHEHGAILCGLGNQACDGKKANMSACIPVPKGGGPAQVRLTAVTMGPIALVTLPGEPLTELGTRVTNAVKAQAPGVDAVLLLGYAQDYTGYLLMPDDWRAGGYEGGFNYWGPRQGVYLADAATALAISLTRDVPTPWESAAKRVYTPKTGPKYKVVQALEAGKVVAQPAAGKLGDELIVEHLGEDPFLGAPTVEVIDAKSGQTVAGGHNAQLVQQLTVTPSFADVPLTYGKTGPPRRFKWRVIVRTQPANPGLGVPLTGQLALRISGVKAPVPLTIDAP